MAVELVECQVSWVLTYDDPMTISPKNEIHWGKERLLLYKTQTTIFSNFLIFFEKHFFANVQNDAEMSCFNSLISNS